MPDASSTGSKPEPRKRHSRARIASDPLTPVEEEFCIRVSRGESQTAVARDLWPGVKHPAFKASNLIRNDPRIKAYMHGLVEHSERRVRQLLEAKDAGFEQRIEWIIEIAKLKAKNPTASLGAIKHLDKLEGRTDEDYKRAGSLTLNYYANAILQPAGRSEDSKALPDVRFRVLEDTAEDGGAAGPLCPEPDADGPGEEADQPYSPAQG